MPFRSRCLLLLACFALTHCGDSVVLPPVSMDDTRRGNIVPVEPSAVQPVQYFANVDVIEASGVQRSLRLPGLIWVHNDSGAGPFIYATDAAGSDLGRIELMGATFSDFEDIGGYALDGVSYLVVGDIGDNENGRANIQLYVLPEPAVETFDTGFRASMADYRRIDVVYDDGAGHDCESMAIDPVRDEVLIVTKSFDPTATQDLWTGKLSSALASGSLTLSRKGSVTGIQRVQPSAGLQPLPGYATTAMDISPDRSEVTILTYSQLYTWQRAPDEDWAAALGRSPTAQRVVPASGNNQAEGVGYSADGRYLLVSAENSLPVSTTDPGSTGSTLSVVARGPETGATTPSLVMR